MKKTSKNEKIKKGTNIRLLKMLFKEFKLPLSIVFLCLIGAAVAMNLSSVFLKNITDDVIHDGLIKGFDAVSSILYKNIIFMAITYILGILCSFIWNRTMAITTQKFMHSFRVKLFEQMESLPIQYFDTHPHGDVMSRYTNDMDTVWQMIFSSFPTIIQSSFSCLILLSIMLYYSVYLALIVILFSIVMLIVGKRIGGNAAKHYKSQQKSLGTVEAFVEESMSGLKVIKVFSHEEEIKKEFKEVNDKLCDHATKANVFSNILMPVLTNIGNLLYVVLALFGCIFISLNLNDANLSLTGFNTLSIGVLVSFLLMARQFTGTVNQLAQQASFLIVGGAGAARCFELLDAESEIDDGYVTLVEAEYDEFNNIKETSKHTRTYAWKHPHENGSVTYSKLEGNIILEDIDFGYIKEKLILKDFSVYAFAGQKVAFVGSTGAGKTTVTNLINRFYDINEGKIRYDGINITKIKKDDLRRSLGIVLQDTNLFTGTVKDNIKYGKLDATDEEVYEAARIANAYDFITRLPKGFDTELSGDGANLSQGQRQLLSIARAAIKDAPVMILDEATSSIDTRTEKLVQDGMDKLMEGRTVFVIAHRLSTVQNSDVIMVLDHGKIIERGPHDELIKLGGTYASLYTGVFELE